MFMCVPRVAAAFLKVCHRSDPKLNECVMSSVEGLRSHLATGNKLTYSLAVRSSKDLGHLFDRFPFSFTAYLLPPAIHFLFSSITLLIFQQSSPVSSTSLSLQYPVPIQGLRSVSSDLVSSEAPYIRQWKILVPCVAASLQLMERRETTRVNQQLLVG
jgi:hypothetical protein